MEAQKIYELDKLVEALEGSKNDHRTTYTILNSIVVKASEEIEKIHNKHYQEKRNSQQ